MRDGRPASPRAPAELVICPEAPAAVQRLRQGGYLVFGVSNQPDVARRALSSDTLAELAKAIRAALPIHDLRHCVHDDGDGCECRKPRPGLLRSLAQEWGVDLGRSYLVGDSWRDMEAGRAVGCRTILLRRAYNLGTSGGDEVASLTEAADLILAGQEPAFSLRFLHESREVLQALDHARLEAMAHALAAVRERGGRLFFLGVGGGAAHASHAVADFRKLAGFEAYAVTENVAELTARINDEGWDGCFAEYLRGSRLRAQDAVFVFSVGGGDRARGVSANLVRALELASQVGASIFGVVGRDGGYTARVADHCVVVPTVNADTVTPHTEAVQALVWHLLVSHPALRRSIGRWEALQRSSV